MLALFPLRRLTVGATDISDGRAALSNIVSCVDIWAPGVDVMSTALYGGSRSMSGTSMGSPHVAGVAALLHAQNPEAKDFIVQTASPNNLFHVAQGFLPPAPTPISVASLNTSTWGATNWRAHVAVLVRDDNGETVPNITVHGEFSPGGRKSCVAAANGACALISAYLSKKNAARMV